MEQHVIIQSEGAELEGLISNGPGQDIGVVVTHPHPLYGGEMRNNVVETVVRTFRDMNFSTLRFNFRGVGHSTGSFDNGKGEQKDVKAAVDFLTDKGLGTIYLAGYSFGAWVNALSISQIPMVKRMIMISPPAGLLDFSSLKDCKKLTLVITGSNDLIAPPDLIRSSLSKWNPHAEFRIVQGADHFYWDYTEALAHEIKESVMRWLQQDMACPPS